MPQTRRKNKQSKSVESKAIKSQLKWREFIPPVRQPSANLNFTFPFVTCTSSKFEGTIAKPASVMFRLEDVMKSIAATVDMGSSWYSLIRIRVISAMAYGQVDKTTDLVPSFTIVYFDPVTSAQGSSRGVIGDIDDPCRSGVHFPYNIQQTLLSWDGVTSTSAPLIGIKSTSSMFASVYWNVVVVVDKNFAVQEHWVPPTSALSNLSVSAEPFEQLSL